MPNIYLADPVVSLEKETVGRWEFMSVVPVLASGEGVPQASQDISFDVFDSVNGESPQGSVSAGTLRRDGFGSPVRSSGPGRKAAASTRKFPTPGGTMYDVRSTEAGGRSDGDGLISAYRDVGTKGGASEWRVETNSNRTPSVVDRAKARLESWRTMADRLERVMVEDEQTKLAGAVRRASPGALKTISQLRKEIVAIKADASARAAVVQARGTHAEWGRDMTTTQSSMDYGRSSAQQQLTLLESKLVRAEAKIQKRDDAIDQLKSSVSQLQASLVAKQEQLQRAKQDAQVAVRSADESREEFSRLKANGERSLARIKGLQSEVTSLHSQLEEAEVNLKKSEQLTALEKSRRLELEQRLVDTDDAISRLKTKVESSKRRMHANHEALDLENRNLRAEVQSLREACLEAKRLATEHAEAAVEVSRQRDAAERETSGRVLEMKELRAELHIAKQQARLAEEAAAEAAAQLYVLKATEKHDAAEMASASELRIEFEATKKVLDSVTASAKVSKAEVSALKEELSKARASHHKELEALKSSHSQVLAEERKDHMEALREIEASHAAQVRQDVDRIEQARAALAHQVEDMARTIREKDETIDGLQKMLKDREAAMEEMKNDMESMRVELMQTQDEVEALLTARLNDELVKASAGASAQTSGTTRSKGTSGTTSEEQPQELNQASARDQARETKPKNSPIKRFIAKLSPKKKTRAEREMENAHL